MSKRVLCKFFAHGACLKGEHCEFSHDWKATPNNICTFYQKGACAFGSRCRYEHVKASRAQSSGSSSSPNSRQSLVVDSLSLSHPSRTSSSGVALSPGILSELSASTGILSELSASSSPFLPPSKPAWNGSLDDDDYSDNGDNDDDGAGVTRSTRPEDHAICSFAAAGNCPRGEKCPHIHGDICPSCGKHCLHPYRPMEREEHMKTCEEKQKQLEALKRSQEIECSVCLERVLSKPTVAERKFGILSECDHPFCVSCIRNWRSSSPTSGMDVNSALRACPICRKLSYFVIPSVIWYNTKEEKQEIIDSYKSRLRSIDCKHFDFGNGNCPFGTSCFYKHTVKPGSYVWKFHRPPPRRPPPRRYDIVPMDVIFHMFEHLEEWDDYILEDLENEDLNPLESELLMQMGFDTSDSSEDEIDLWPVSY
ncbi:PREDICTED: E3 ubiquitin-ligase [Prunus dulcis]|uniref:PREDICTED: E3 ubiquitin-ligase n=1 Tax=Prunus dulcis TaxID=3755 RepID=A0A5E4G2Y4_PRUDU|nr:putative RING-type E3 ubiquitin transferase C3H69 isoform X1 [Prunus dulcis]VVA33968.1 PREDICTED: E3 ubiquitin-ligase [Prunus dulcis]